MWTIVELGQDYWVILWNGEFFGYDGYASLDEACKRLADWWAGR